jgi:hypothetical protein
MGYAMKTKPALWIALLFFLPACAFFGTKPASPPTPVPAPTQEILIPPTATTPACIDSAPTQADIDRALEFTGNLFASADWERSYTVMDGRVGVTWLSNPLGAVVYLEALIFPCGYEDQDLDAYFIAENWAVIFENYESYEILSSCRTDGGLRLYEIRTESMGFNYDVHYWARNDTDHRVLTVMMTFPEGSDPVSGEYATRLFPPLTDCR